MNLDASLSLRFKGDWGAFNLTRICGWLAFGVFQRTGAVHHVIHTGRGMADNLFALARGEVDVSIATPAAFARLARAGHGPFEGAPMPELRALGVLPHRDALLIAVPAQLGISSMAELRERQPALRVSLAEDDGESFMGFGARIVLEASGVELADIVSWGGELVYGEDPSECVAHVTDGRADAIVQEAIMTPWWDELARTHDLRFLSLEPDVAAAIARDLDLETMELEPGYLTGMDDPVRALDFSGWQVVVREDLDHEIAELLTALLCETADLFERQYRHLPVRNSPLDYPITPERLAEVAIPLHDAAAAYYERTGVKSTRV
jgi:uncharacterized protein